MTQKRWLRIFVVVQYFCSICLILPKSRVGNYRPRMKTRSKHQGSNVVKSAESSCQSPDLPSRWSSGRSSPNSIYDAPSTGKRRACDCAAGITGDVAAVCCCPLSLLHLFALALVKLPQAAVRKVVRKVKRKISGKSKRVVVHEDECESVPPAASFPPSRSRSYEEDEGQSWTPALGFGDPRQWREFFGSPDVWANGEVTKDFERKSQATDEFN